jgi:hypothetical protein
MGGALKKSTQRCCKRLKANWNIGRENSGCDESDSPAAVVSGLTFRKAKSLGEPNGIPDKIWQKIW